MNRHSDNIWGLVCGLPEPVRKRRRLLMLKAYFDDSQMGQKPLYILAGWVASAEVWAKFADDWADILRMSPRIDYFKWAEASNFKGQFGGISETSRDEKLRLLVRAIADHGLLGITMTIPHHLFDPLFGQHANKNVRNPYTLAFYAIIDRLVGHFVSTGLNDKIEFIFDYQPGSNSMAMVESGWEAFLEDAPPEWLRLVARHPPSFLDDKETVGLQAADLHAGWIRTLDQASLLNQPLPPPIWGDVGDKITRLYRQLTAENTREIYDFFIAKKWAAP